MRSEIILQGRLPGLATQYPKPPVVRKDMPSPYEPADGVKFVILTTSGKDIFQKPKLFLILQPSLLPLNLLYLI